MIFKARSRSKRFDLILLGFITIVAGGTGLLLYRIPDRFIFYITRFFLLSCLLSFITHYNLAGQVDRYGSAENCILCF